MILGYQIAHGHIFEQLVVIFVHKLFVIPRHIIVVTLPEYYCSRFENGSMSFSMKRCSEMCTVQIQSCLALLDLVNNGPFELYAHLYWVSTLAVPL